MLAVLRTRSRVKGWAVIACAYAFALHMLLAGVVATQMAVADPAHATICYGNPDQDGGATGGTARIHHSACVVCALASLTAPPCDGTQAHPLRSVVAAERCFACAAPERLAQRHTPRSSQGPPPAA